MIQDQLGQLLRVVLRQPVAGPFQDVEAVGAVTQRPVSIAARRPRAGSPDPHTYRVGTATGGTPTPNGVAARYQASAADSAPGSARARV